MDRGEFYSLFGMAWVFGWVIVALVAWHMKNKQRAKKLEIIHEERMKAMEKGIPLPEVPEFEEKRNHGGFWRSQSMNPRWPLGVGAILVMGGLGTSLALHLSGDALHNEIWPFGLIAVFVGAGLFLHYWLTTKPAS